MVYLHEHHDSGMATHTTILRSSPKMWLPMAIIEKRQHAKARTLLALEPVISTPTNEHPRTNGGGSTTNQLKVQNVSSNGPGRSGDCQCSCWCSQKSWSSPLNTSSGWMARIRCLDVFFGNMLRYETP